MQGRYIPVATQTRFVTPSFVHEATLTQQLPDPATPFFAHNPFVQARYIQEATQTLPIIGDGDTGYGNALNVKRTVKGYARAGMAGVFCVCVYLRVKG